MVIMDYRTQRAAMMALSVEERFWSKVDKSGDCWLWLGAKDHAGYGRFRDGNTTVLAHRWAYEHDVGPILNGETIDHLCRATSCVNASHMDPVPLAENLRRGGNSLKTHCPQEHQYSGENLRITRQGDRKCRTCERARVRRQRLN